MQILIDEAAKGKRAALTGLFEKYWREAKVLCVGLLVNESYAENAAVWAFQRVWSDVLTGQIQTEEDFRQKLLEKATIYCRRKCQKKGQASLPVPIQKNFYVTAGKGNIEGQNVWEAMRLSLPLAGRFVFTLHRVAGFDKKTISEMTGLKYSVIEAAMIAEEHNVARLCSIMDKENISDAETCLEQEIEEAVTNATLSEITQKQILESIDVLVAPLEKEVRKKKLIHIGMGTVAVLIIVVFVAIGKTWLGARDQTDEMLQESVSEEEPETNAAEDNSVEDATENNGSSDGAETENIDEGAASDTASTGASEITATHYADIVIENYGTITVALDGNTAPKTVENFVSLAEEGFYDGLTFHRIKDGFMMQGGDPNGDGTGGSPNTIIGEFEDNGYENPLSHIRGAISMARSNDYDSASSQFFIVHEDSLSLDGQYAVFGYVTEGMDVVDQICTSAEPIDDNGTIPSEEQPVIASVTIRST